MLWLPGSVQMMLASSPREADDESHRSPAKNLGIPRNSLGIPPAASGRTLGQSLGSTLASIIWLNMRYSSKLVLEKNTC